MNTKLPTSIVAQDAPLRLKSSVYPEPFASLMVGRRKGPLGNIFGLSNFGVNLTLPMPGAHSALNHAHSKQDEFIYILTEHPTLILDQREILLDPGMCAGFRASTGQGHHLENRTDEEA